MRRNLRTTAILCLHRVASVILAVLLVLDAGTAWPASAEDAQHFIQDLAEKAISTVAAGNISDEDRRQNFRRLFVSAFDIHEIGKCVLSRYWHTATPAQQREFLKQFEDMQVLVWSERFKGYHGETLQILGATAASAGVWDVNSHIIRPDAPPLPVRWRVEEATDGTLRIIDIIPENVSMALTQRQDFTNVLRQNGGNLEVLLSSMQAKNRQLKSAP